VFLNLFGMNEATLMRGPPDGGKRSARTDNALHGAGADVGDPRSMRRSSERQLWRYTCLPSAVTWPAASRATRSPEDFGIDGN
jgi:hypothetical protein